MAVRKYRQDLVKATIGGVVMQDLVQDGSMSIEYDESRVTKSIDQNGGGVFNISSSDAGTITMTFLNPSPYLSAIINLGQLTYSSEAGYFPILIEDKNQYENKMKWVCDKAMLQQIPSFEFGNEAGEVEVVFECINLLAVSAPVNVLPTFELS